MQLCIEISLVTFQNKTLKTRSKDKESFKFIRFCCNNQLTSCCATAEFIFRAHFGQCFFPIERLIIIIKSILLRWPSPKRNLIKMSSEILLIIMSFATVSLSFDDYACVSVLLSLQSGFHFWKWILNIFFYNHFKRKFV